ncbi:AcrR family transcriptional regulator [Devosia subaequoris]|uniref:AcrR family transcriptional regulator n=1 Tax=Devosia subaequoris TaxID=395930 RepID=A0A7W6NCA7_9HYPH|nr:TetR/AcrR family transcriptional regulator [Devosia subaequoris]MBB4052872.1 AcrR family transcriptional regulator [Devosia subaequoris]MCP1210023.1 TetR/AcrR family transcriptional regulator [Devosia subaequoris]
MRNEEAETLRSEVLWKAMVLFWEKGVAETSYSEIVEATRTSRKALYGWWPDKASLVRETLRVYQEGVLNPTLTPLIETGSPEALERFWNLIEAAVSSESWRGCYLCRTGSSRVAEDEVVAQMFHDHVARIEKAVASMIAVRQQHGRCPEHIEPSVAGQASAAFIVLMSALAASGAEAEGLSRLVDSARESCGIKRAGRS